MKKVGLAILFVICVLALGISNADAVLLHAPHDGGNSVTCDSCHTDSLQTIADRNAICLDCHDNTTNPPLPAPQVKTHSAAVINGNYTNWGQECLDCHDPHFQQQLTNFTVQAFYLATGSISSVNSPTNISYTGLTSLPGWDPATNGSKWGAKSSTGRGLILVIIDPSQADKPLNNTFEVVSVDAVGSTITVNGDMTGMSGSFGIIYGQLVKSTVNASPVIFTGPTTFADNDGAAGGDDSTPDGICQVCHTLTHYWLSNGTLSQTHNSGTNCMGCHKHDQGFKGDVPDHLTSMYVTYTNNGTCENCHMGDVLAGLDTHESNCDLCHADAAGGNYTLIGSAMGRRVPEDVAVNTCADCHTTIRDDWYQHQLDHTPTGFSYVLVNSATTPISSDCVSCHTGDVITGVHDRAGAGGTAACQKCHNSSGALIGSAAGKTGGGECITCHTTYFNGHLAHNDTTHDVLQRSTDLSDGQFCNACHKRGGTSSANPLFTNTWGGTDGIYALHQSSCGLCHDSTRTANTTGTGVQNIIANGVNVACLDCHTDRATGHAHTANDFNWTTSCGTSRCHNEAGNADIINSPEVHNGDCALCHVSPSTGDWTRKGSAVGQTRTAFCADCHNATWEVIHSSGNAQPNHLNAVSGIVKCTSCHDATAGTATGIPTSISNNMVHDDCLTCHNADGSINASASPGSDGVANCADCHSLYNTDFAGGHQNEDHGNVVGVTPCTDCHTGNVITSVRVHDSNCFTSSCHVSTSDGTLTNSASGHTVGSPSNCKDCHGQSFAHDTNTDHDKRPIAWTLGTTAACDGCHSSDNDTIGSPGAGSLTTQANVDALHDKNWDGTIMANQCELCHWYVQAWANPEGLPLEATIANYIANGKGPAGTPVECTDCHSYNANDHGGHAPDDFTWDPPSCGTSNCHNQAGNSDIVQSPDVHNGDCALCHVDPVGGNWNRRSFAIGKTRTASCGDCHGPDSEAAHHGGVQAQAGNCTWCHADPRPGWPGTPPNPIPSQLFCVKCHIEPGGTGLVVYRNTYTPVPVSSFPSGDDQWPINGDASVQQTPVHTITGAAKIDVQNYGACLGCHDGNTPGAPQIQIWHAKPTWNKNTHDTASNKYDNTFDVLRNAPGRSYFANNNTPPSGNGDDDTNADERRFNIFATGANTGGVEKLRIIGRYVFGNASVDQPYDDDSTQSSQERGKRLYKDYQDNNNNPWNNSVWSNRLQIPRNSFNNPQGLLSSDPHVPLP